MIVECHLERFFQGISLVVAFVGDGIEMLESAQIEMLEGARREGFVAQLLERCYAL